MVFTLVVLDFGLLICQRLQNIRKYINTHRLVDTSLILYKLVHPFFILKSPFVFGRPLPLI
jgi:hypothetical protein